MRMSATFTVGALIAVSLLAPASGQEVPTDVDFVSRIEPILSQNCHKCHGPEHPKGGLRLDRREAALRGGDTTDQVLVPGQSTKSDLIARLRSTDPDVMMPPKGKRVPPDQIALLAKWIDAGAVWSGSAAAA